MIDFMVLSLPRSGSTWAANWLTTGETYCPHDPLYTSHFSDFDRNIVAQAGGRIAGISCTGTGWLWPDWVNAHPARKLILRRPLKCVQKSLGQFGWPALPGDADIKLGCVAGWHIPYTDLFDTAKAAGIWEWLTGCKFDAARHRDLAAMRIEPRPDCVRVDRAVEARLLESIS